MFLFNEYHKIQAMMKNSKTEAQPNCHHCDGKGYIFIRDCSGEIQREETCVFCNGTGTVAEED